MAVAGRSTRHPAGTASMLSFLKSLFGGARSGRPEPAAEPVEYKGFRITPAPYAASGGFQTAGTIAKDFPEGAREHRFVRAETHPSRDDAAAFAVRKAQQIIDEQGDRLFGPAP
jgi:hypothetical protein